MSDRLCATENSGLLAFLQARLKGWSRNTIKQRLQAGCVSVNGVVVTRHDHGLAAGDEVEVFSTARKGRPAPASLKILHEDPQLIAIDKPAGLLSVGNDQETQLHALALLRHQLSRSLPSVKLFPVHRIDRDTSGVLLFATSRETREAVMARWDEAEKTYLAVVEGCPDPARGTIDQPLRMDEEEYRMHVGPHPEAKRAVTHYETEQTVGERSLVRVRLETGRQHQIRAHMAWLGCPVVGDPRYGTAGPRLGLHALRLCIALPGGDRKLIFEAPVPKDFWALLK